MYYVYVIESESSGRYYIGQTGNLEERLERHNKGRVKSTKGRGPWKLKYYFELKTRREAVSLEQKLKNIKKRDLLIKYCNIRGVAQPGPVFARIFDPVAKTRILEKSGKSKICDFSGLAREDYVFCIYFRIGKKW
jgi:putative endonuclease